MTNSNDDGAFGASSVTAIKYNFDSWLGTKDGEITVPEPSTEAVVKFWAEWSKAYDDATYRATRAEDEKVPEDESPEDRDDRMMRLQAEAFKQADEFTEKRRAILSELCSGIPSVETLSQLPFRVRRAFEGYVAGKLGPEA